MKEITKITLLLFCVLILASCSTYKELQTSEDGKTRTIATEQAGELEVNSDIKRPVMFRSSDPLNAYLLGVEPVGVHEILKDNELINDLLADTNFISPEDIHNIESLRPDLIVTYAPDEHAKAYKDIAPTIEMRYITGGLSPYKKRIYLTHLYYIGVILNKEKEAKQQADEWLERIPKFRSQLKEQVTDKNAVVLNEGDTGNFQFQPEFSSFGTEAVFDVLGFNQTKIVKRFLEEKEQKHFNFDQDYEEVEADYVFVSTATPNKDKLKQQISDSFHVDQEHIILMNQPDFRPNDLLSIEKQTNTIIDTLNNK